MSLVSTGVEQTSTRLDLFPRQLRQGKVVQLSTAVWTFRACGGVLDF